MWADLNDPVLMHVVIEGALKESIGGLRHRSVPGVACNSNGEEGGSIDDESRFEESFRENLNSSFIVLLKESVVVSKEYSRWPHAVMIMYVGRAHPCQIPHTNVR